MAQMTEPRYDPALEQYVATLPDGREVYGNTWAHCARRRADALHTIARHAQVNGTEETLDADPMAPDYEALGAESITSQYRDSAEAAEAAAVQ